MRTRRKIPRRNPSDGRYNGWTNYATWRIRLEVFDGMDDGPTTAGECEEFVEEIVLTDIPDGLAKDWARAFLSEVNWREIADANKDDFEEFNRLDDEG